MNKQTTGIQAALSSAIFLGLAPIFGKLAINSGFPPLAVVALRTILAAGLLLLVILIFQRRYLYIYPAGLIGCLLAGGINGAGSLLYYSALGRLDASMGQLLYSLYPIFVALWFRLDRQPLTRLTFMRLVLVVPAIYLLTQTGHSGVDVTGMIMMLAASALYALHLPVNQRVLLDMPPQTVTLYTLLAMSAVVTPAYFYSISSGAPPLLVSLPATAWAALLCLTLVTFFSRLTLFVGIKHLGGMQTALLGLGELLVTLFVAHLFLAERFTGWQWAGTILLLIALLLIKLEKLPTKKLSRGRWLSWLRPPGLPTDLPLHPHD